MIRAPGAIQIADRFHLLRNLGDALGKVFQRHAAVLKEALAVATQNNDHCPALPPAPSAAETEALQAPVTCLPSEAEQGNRTMRQQAFEEVRLLVEHGMTISDISRKTGLDRNTVRKFTQTEKLPERTARPKRASLLDRLSWLVLRRDEKLSEEEHQTLKVLLSANAEVAHAITLAQTFACMVRQRLPDALDP